MPTHSRFESLPAEILSGILTLCSREDLVNLAQACSSLRTVCRKELVNYPFTMRITSDTLKSWVAYLGKENTLLTRGARSLNITIRVAMQDLLDAFDDVDSTVFDVDAQTIHPDADRILPLPYSLRKLSLKTDWMPDPDEYSHILLVFLLRSLPERCPHLEELSVQARPEHPSDEIDRYIRRLTHLRKLHIQVPTMPNIPNRLSLLPASLTDLNLCAMDIKTQEDVAMTIPWVRGIRKIKLMTGTPQCTADVLMILARGSATHLADIFLWEDQCWENPATTMSQREALTVGLQEFSLLHPPLHTLILKDPSGWSDFLHLPLLHTAVASTLTHLSLQDVDSCVFPSYLPWPLLRSLKLSEIPKMGYQGPLIKPIFPVLTALTMYAVCEIQAPEDLFPALEMIKWQSVPKPDQVASLVRHDLKRIEMHVRSSNNVYEPLWEAMGGHTIDLIVVKGRFPRRIKQHTDSGKRVFPEFPNIREISLLGWC